MTKPKQLHEIQQIPVSYPGEERIGFPQSKVTVVSNVVTVQIVFEKKGQVGDGHRHAHDHQTLLAKGSVKCDVEGKVSVFHAPHIIIIRKDKYHQFEALEDDTIIYCVHALRFGSGVDDVVDPDDEVGCDVVPISFGVSDV